jgi:predicted regulator of Ras-like GTPase activity (Roadblock/LC7/MglB family)
MTRAGGSWFFEEADRRRLADLLNTYLTETGNRCAMVLDREGQLLTSVGDVSGLDGIAFASLAAADFAASGELARQFGETEFNSLYHEGDGGSLYLHDLGGRAILAAVFDDRTTLGMVRLGSRSLVPQLAAVFEQLSTRREPSQVLDGSWAVQAADEIDRLFKE